MKKRSIIALLVALLMVLAACADTGSDDTTTTTAGEGGDTTTTTEGDSGDTTTTTEGDMASEWPEKIVYGFIPSEQAETLGDTIQPYMEFLSNELGIEVEGVVTQDYNGLVVVMGVGQAQLGAFGLFGYVQAESLYPGQLEVLMQSIRFGSGTYHGQWFTNDPSICDEAPVSGALENSDSGPELKPGDEVVALQVGWTFGDSGLEPETLDDGTPVDPGTACIASLDKVVGKTIAFTSATSTSGSVFPTLQLINAGIDPENDVEYSYLGSHTDTVAAVYNGDFDIGLSFDDARRNIREDNPDVGSKVIVFNITDEIPNDVVVASSDLPDDLKQAIFDATVAFLETEDGVALFDEIYGWTDVREADDSEFDVVREAAAELGIEND